MKISLKWLNKYLPIANFTAQKIADKFTFAGIEVASITNLAKGTNLVIGEIISCVPHPDSNHLHILEVDEGEKFGVHQIVCGAPNARVGLKVIVAREGAILPEITIVKSEIRGVSSDGMCCSLSELGVDKKFLSEKQMSGIEELPSEAKVGNEDVLGYLGLDDTILDLELLANRGDLLSVHNIASELSAILDLPLKFETFPALEAKVDNSFSLSSETNGCSIFNGLIAKNITVKPSPLWLREALISSGIRPINNIVDIGNYAMLLFGQPINMYDLDKLEGSSLCVKDDFEGDFLAMDDKTYVLKKGDLVVSSPTGPMCLAGLMTSKEASVTTNSKNIVVEAALFDGARIRRTANRIGLFSDSSARFIKGGVSPFSQEETLEAIASLLKDLGEAKELISLKPYNVYKYQENEISCSREYINKRLGTSFSLDIILKTLSRDHFVIEEVNGESFKVSAPKYRSDIKDKEDLSEEVIRLLGYDNIISKLPSLPLTSEGGLSSEEKDARYIRNYLRHLGFSEIITYSLVGKKDISSFTDLGKYEHYQVKNPLTEDRMYLRSSLLPSLLEVAKYNLSRQENDFGIFEVSDVDALNYAGKRLAILLSGKASLRGELEERNFDFYDAKGIIEGILSLLRLSLNRFKKDNNVGPEWHPYRSERLLLGKKPVAIYGEIHPSLKEELSLPKEPIILLEIDLNELLLLKASQEKASLPPKFPSIRRDLAFLVKKDVAYENIRLAVSKLDKRIEKISIFDLYEGKKIESYKKSMALHLSLRKEDGTMEENEAKEIMDKVILTLKNVFDCEVRS